MTRGRLIALGVLTFVTTWLGGAGIGYYVYPKWNPPTPWVSTQVALAPCPPGQVCLGVAAPWIRLRRDGEALVLEHAWLTDAQMTLPEAQWRTLPWLAHNTIPIPAPGEGMAWSARDICEVSHVAHPPAALPPAR